MSNYSDSSFNEESANTSWYKAFHAIPNKTKVLDVGCSSGNFGYELIGRKDCVVDGIEVFEGDAKLAAKKLRHVYVLNIEHDDLSEIKDRYDVLYFGDVIEHLVDPVAALKRVKTLLNSEGAIVFSIPNMAYIGVRLDLLDGNFDYTETGLLDKTHLHFYTLREIERVFNEAGYEIKFLDYVQKDYPKKVIESQLKKHGLKATASFYDKTAEIEASAFQFVGVAAKTTKPKRVKREQFGPVDLFENYLNNTIGQYQQQIKDLKSENERLTAEIQEISHNPAKHFARRVKRRLITRRRQG